MASLKDVIKQRWILKGSNTPEDIRVKFFAVYGVFGTTTFFAYSIINFIIKDYPIAIVEFILALTVLWAMLLAFKTEYRKRGIVVGVLSLLIISVHNITSGGFNRTGILWSYIFPLIALFLAGRKVGTMLFALFLSTTIGLFTLGKLDLVTFVYTDFEFMMFLVSIITVFIMTYVYELAWTLSVKVVKEKQENGG